jgi:hypothetical protein
VSDAIPPKHFDLLRFFLRFDRLPASAKFNPKILAATDENSARRFMA